MIRPIMATISFISMILLGTAAAQPLAGGDIGTRSGDIGRGGDAESVMHSPDMGSGLQNETDVELKKGPQVTVKRNQSNQRKFSISTEPQTTARATSPRKAPAGPINSGDEPSFGTDPIAR